MDKHRIFTTELAKVYPLYVQKAERKNRTKDEVDQIIRWLTGYEQAELDAQIRRHSDLETFFCRGACSPSERLADHGRGGRHPR